MEIFKSLKASGLLIKCVTKSIENEAKQQGGKFPVLYVPWYCKR